MYEDDKFFKGLGLDGLKVFFSEGMEGVGENVFLMAPDPVLTCINVYLYHI